MKNARFVVSAASLFIASGHVLANPATIVLANNAHAGTSGRDAVPGMTGFQFTNFGKVYGSSGTRWVTAANITGAGTTTATDQVVLVGNGTSISVAAREGITAVGASGQLLNLSGLATPRINASGQWAIAFTPAAGNPGLVVRSRAGGYDTLAVGSAASQFPGYNYGPGFASAAISDAGGVWFQTDTTSGLPRAAFGENGQTRVDLEASTDLGAAYPDVIAAPLRTMQYSVAATNFHVSADGQTTMLLGDADINFGVRSAIVNNQIVLQVGQAAPGTTGLNISTITETWLESDGTWFARVTLSDSSAAIYRNRVLIARVGAPVSPGAGENWTVITDYKGDPSGNFVVIGTTNGPSASNQIALLNGTDVISRSGDPVDLNGDGQMNDNLFIHSFRDRCFMGSDSAFYVGARMKSTAAGTSSLGANVSMIRVPFIVCIGDFNHDGGVDGSDIEAFFRDWEAGLSTADVNRDGGVDGADVESFFGRWESGC
jgi:hypothetical protein